MKNNGRKQWHLRESKITEKHEKEIRNIGLCWSFRNCVCLCKVGPNYQEPEDETPQTFRYHK